MYIPIPTDEEIAEYEQALTLVRESQQQKIKNREEGKRIEEEYNFKINSMKQTDKKMFILFAMDGCPACKVLKHLVSYNEQVMKALEPYETLIINVSTSESHLIKKMNVYSFPAYYMIDKNEKIIKQNYGCNALTDPALSFIEWINI